MGSVSPTRASGQPEKDPDVWSPPAPKQEYGKQNKINPSAFNANQRPPQKRNIS